MLIDGQSAIRDAYRDETVAREYIDRRFREPIGALVHAHQVRRLRQLIQEHRPRHVLEIAPGPARLTVEVARLVPRGVAVDASAQMLAVARRRLAETSRRWQFIQADAFHLPFSGEFDLAYAFRLIRHFRSEDRVRLYAGLHRVLRRGGLLVFDAVNEKVSAPLRAKAGPGEYAHYDALFQRDALTAELEGAGFEVVALTGVQRRFPALRWTQVMVAPRSRLLARLMMEAIDRAPAGEPLEWIVTCRRR